MIYYALLAALALQRIGELKIGNGNLERVQERLYEPPDRGEKNRMIALHVAWFLSCGLEHAWRGGLASTGWFVSGMAVLSVCQLVRQHSMSVLGESWIHLPVAYRGQRIMNSGLYRYLRHPNYLAVAVEIAVVPLMAKAYLTAALFSAANAAFLKHRISIEETQLKKVREL